MKRALAIAGVFPPFGGAGAVRLVKLFRSLAQHGWRVEVIAPRGRAGWHRDPTLGDELGDIRVHRVGFPSRPAPLVDAWRQAAKDPERTGPRAIVRARAVAAARLCRDLVSVPDEYLLWALAAWERGRRLLRETRFDALFTSSFPYSCHLAGLGLAVSGGLPWLAELRDPWYGHQFRQQARWWRRPIDLALERQVVTHARGLIAVTPGIAELLAAHHGERLGSRLTVLTNGFDPADFVATRPSARPGPFELLYVGTFEEPVAPPDTILAALDELLQKRERAADELRLRIVGGADLASAAKIRAWNERHPAARMITVEPFRPHAEATALMSGADALLLCIGDGAPWVLTSKLFEYIGSQRPIVAVVPDGDARDVLERCGGATLFRPGEARPLAAALERFLISGRVMIEVPRDPGAIAAYRFDALAAKLAARLDEVAGA